MNQKDIITIINIIYSNDIIFARINKKKIRIYITREILSTDRESESRARAFLSIR